MNLRELLIKVGFEVDEKPIHGAEAAIESLTTKLEILAGAEIIKKLFEISERFAEWGERLQVTAANLGISTEEIQKLGFAAEKSGVSTEQMTTGLARLSRQIYEAKTGSKEAAETFRKAGISAEQVKGFRNAEDALFALSDRLQNIQDPIKRTAIAQELLGRGGYQMVAFLSKGSKAIQEQGNELRRLGLILSGPQVEALESAAHAFGRLHAVMNAIGASIASYIGPAFEYVIDKFIAFYAANKNIIGLNLTNWLNGVAYTIGFVAGLIHGATVRVLEFAKAWGFEGSILKVAASFAGITLGILAVVKAGNIALGIFRSLSSLFSILTGTAGILWRSLVVMSSGIWAAVTASWALIAPWLPFIAIAAAVVAAIAAIVAIVHDLYALAKGKPTWIGELIEWAKSFDLIKNGIEGFKHIWESLKSLASGGVDWIVNMGKAFGEWVTNLAPVKAALEFIGNLSQSVSGKVAEIAQGVANFFGIGGGGASPGARVDNLNTPQNGLSGVTNNTSNGAPVVNNHFNTNAPITQNLGGHVSPAAAAKAAQDGVREHLDKNRRDTNRAVQGPVKY